MKQLNLLFYFALAVLLFACNKPTINDFAIGFYNCENLFDTVDNAHVKDEDFTPNGSYHYNSRLFRGRIHNIATAIAAMNQQHSVLICGLAEVENDDVLNTLIKQPELIDYNYAYKIINTHDNRGISIAMLYAADYCNVLDVTTIEPGDPNKHVRAALKATITLFGDSITTIINHWPSRLNNDEAANLRSEMAAMESNTLNSIDKEHGGWGTIVMGDYNDNPEDSSVHYLSTHAALDNPFERLHAEGRGTECYRGTWNLFDQILSSRNLSTESKLHWRIDSAEIFAPAFLRDTYKGHTGEPYRAFKGTHWIKGYSDHFPVMLVCHRTQ